MQILNKILEARENRAFLRKKIAQKGKISLSLSLNIPGYPKFDEKINSFFKIIISEIEIYLNANRVFLKLFEKNIDEAGNFVIYELINNNLSSLEIKNLTEKFEENHQAGRIIDVDITDSSGMNISSGKTKKCIVCNLPAIICMKEQNHDYSELRNIIFEKINDYLSSVRKEKIINKITETAIKSLLYEVSLTPKPGLVDFEKNGSHSDMNFFTFLNSTAALSPYFRNLAEKGYTFLSDFSEALPEIRKIGLQMEKSMFLATNNVNTQKGLIFLMGLSVFATAKLLSENDNFNYEDFQVIVKSICKNITHNELYNNSLNSTHGEKVFAEFGEKAGGARLEVELGFPTVFNYSLPVLEKYAKKSFFETKENTNIALQKTLISLISKNNDTNILYRKGKKTLENLKLLAQKVLSDEIKYNELEYFCKNENISPGGSADLLAITVFLYFLRNEILL